MALRTFIGINETENIRVEEVVVYHTVKAAFLSKIGKFV